MRIALALSMAVLAACAAKPGSSTSSSASGGSQGFGMYCSGTMYKPCHADQQACEEADGTGCLWINDLYCYTIPGPLTCWNTEGECYDAGGENCHRRAPL